MVRKNIKTIEDVKEKINDLPLEQSEIEQIVELIDEFEKHTEFNDGNILREIMIKVSSISVSAGAVLYDYSENTDILSKIMSK